MSKGAISSWASGIGQGGEKDVDGENARKWDGKKASWETYIGSVRRDLFDSSTKLRVGIMKEELGELVRQPHLSMSQITDIFGILTLVYPRYVDKWSREAAEVVVTTLITADEKRGERFGVVSHVVAWLSSESARISKSGHGAAASDRFVLLHFAAAIYTTSIGHVQGFVQSPAWAQILDATAALLDALSLSAKPSMQTSAVDCVKRALRSKQELIPKVLQTLLGQGLSVTRATMIGVVVPLLPSEADLVPLRATLNTFHTSQILLSKTPVPTHQAIALRTYLSTLTPKELDEVYLPTLEKALLRAPEVALFACKPLLTSYTHELTQPQFERVLNPILSSSKSSNPATRKGAVELFEALISVPSPTSSPTQSPSSISHHTTALTHLLTPLKTSKTSSPEHRLALYSMLSLIPPSAAVSTAILGDLSVLIAKESNESMLSELGRVGERNLAYLLKDGEGVGKATVDGLVKDAASGKAGVKRMLCGLIGSVLWCLRPSSTSVATAPSTQVTAFIDAILPVLEGYLKTAASITPSSTAGVVEGYVGVAGLVVVKSFGGAYSARVDAILKQYPALLNFSQPTTGGKTSFLVYDKVYAKLTNEEEERWLLRALEGVLLTIPPSTISIASPLSPTPSTPGSASGSALPGLSEQAARLVGLTFIHLAVDSKHPSIRRETVETLSRMTSTVGHEGEVNSVIIAGLTVYITSSTSISVAAAAGKEDEDAAITARNEKARKANQLRLVLGTCASYGEGAEKDREDVKEEMLKKSLLLGHCPAIGEASQQSWVDLLQRAGVDAGGFTQKWWKELVEITCPSSTSSAISRVSEHPLFRSARYHAITTLSFINPDVFLPHYVRIIEELLNPQEFKGLTSEDLEIWKGEEGKLVMDVLAGKKQQSITTKGKDAAIQKWEAEIRQTLSSKPSKAASSSASTAKLSKADEAIVRAQLFKESEVRKRVEALRQRVLEALEVSRSLVRTGIKALRPYLGRVAEVLRESGKGWGGELVGWAVGSGYLELAGSFEESFVEAGRWAGIATLRAVGVKGLPEEMGLDGIEKLMLRVLYRCNTLAQSKPFEPATITFLMPLLSELVAKGGFKPSPSAEVEEKDLPLEQLALTLNLLRAHNGNIDDISYPRIEMLKNVITILTKHLQLAKEGSSLLVGLTEGMAANTSREEIDFLIKSSILEESHARNAILSALQPLDLTDLDWSPEIWILCHDKDELNARLARKLWDENGLDVAEGFVEPLLAFFENSAESVRWSAARSLPESLESWPGAIGKLLKDLQVLYVKNIPNTEPQYDELGILISDGSSVIDPWPTRVTVGHAFRLVASFMNRQEVEGLFDFLIKKQALGDKHGEVRRSMLEAGVEAVEVHGATHVSEMMSRFETHLASSSKSSDEINEAIVVLYGRLARHLKPDDTRLPKIVDQLVMALKTPSEQVQVAVAECLSPLAPMLPEIDKLVEGLFKEMLEGAKYGHRRGAAYGLSGVIHGLGISSIKAYEVMDRLRQALGEKKKYEPRQGAMFALETLATTLTRLFEPYITQVIPLLLQAYGDGTGDVREATEDASKAIMGSLSSYGVKLVLPSLLDALEEKQWRTKKGAIELLGAMAYCSPRQLSISLPTIIPRLTSVLTDSHAQVRAAANKSLKQFGEVISNPEIQRMVPVLLKGLVDPDKIPNGLSVLLKTSFMHYIDSPSLALVIPILERGLKQRGDPKRKACQIVGNMASLTDTKDFVPYLSRLMPLVHGVLVDPVPEARATAAKALGTLVERMGESYFPDLVPGLLQTLKSESSAVDRQGAAQGLSEVLSGLGMERLEGLLPDIISNSTSSRPFVREGFMSLLIYLPATFGTRFQPHLSKIVSPILSGLADDEQTVQDAAMKAGRMIIVNYSNRAVDLLLPELEVSMFNEGWRIRQSSLTLVGELLFKITGISGKTDLEEEEGGEVDTSTVEISRKALTEQLGPERRDRLLASFYILRQDAVSLVRQSAIQIWKALVQNTPRTIREILPSLIDKVLELLATSGSDQQEMAARTIGELCRKFGERLVLEIIPLLQKAARSEDRRTREGVCVALSNIMENTTDTQREGHEDDIVVIVRDSLVDPAPNVRAAAAKTFDILQQFMGARAIDQTIPTLLESLRQPGESSGTALQALREVMTVRSATVFPVLIPTLLATPITVFNLRALGSLVTVAGNALSKRVSGILGTLVKLLESESDEQLLSEAQECTEAVLQSIDDLEGLNTLMLLLLGWSKHDNPTRRASAAKLFEQFANVTTSDFSLYRVDWVRQLIAMYDDPVSSVIESAVSSFTAFAKSIPKDDYEGIVVSVRRSIESTGAPGRTVPGFAITGALTPFVPIIIAGLTTGSNEQKEHAAYAISDLVDRTDQAAFKPVVVGFTGPLIRVATQATSYPPPVKVAILTALEKEVRLIPSFVKPFFPQLQRTFAKAVGDPSSINVRARAADALGELMKHQPRVDQICAELITGATNEEEDESIQASFVYALAMVIRNAWKNIGDATQTGAADLLGGAFNDHTDQYIDAIAELFASMTAFPELIEPLTRKRLTSETPPTSVASTILLAVLSLPPEIDPGPAVFSLMGSEVMAGVAKKITLSASSDRQSISRCAKEARDFMSAMDCYAEVRHLLR